MATPHLKGNRPWPAKPGGHRQPGTSAGPSRCYGSPLRESATQRRGSSGNVTAPASGRERRWVESTASLNRGGPVLRLPGLEPRALVGGLPLASLDRLKQLLLVSHQASSSVSSPRSLALDNDDPLAGVSIGVRVLEIVEQIAALNVEHDLRSRCQALSSASRSPRRSTSPLAGSRDVCLLGTHWHRPECAQECAQTRSEDNHSLANANQATNKNGPEIA